LTWVAIPFSVFYIVIGGLVSVCAPNSYSKFRKWSLMLVWPVLLGIAIWRRRR